MINYLLQPHGQEKYQNKIDNEMIAKYGCYFCSLINYDILNHNKRYSNADVISFYKKFVHLGYLESDCTVLNMAAILANLTRLEWQQVSYGKGEAFIKLDDLLNYPFEDNRNYCLIVRYRNETAGNGYKSHFMLAKISNSTVSIVVNSLYNYSSYLSNAKISDFRLAESGVL